MPSGQGCGWSEGVQVLFSAFSRGREGSSAEAIACPIAGTVLHSSRTAQELFMGQT